MWSTCSKEVAKCLKKQVGNEFSSVEALWSQFENVMAKDPDAEADGHAGEDEREGGHGEDDTELPDDHGNGH